MAETMGHSNVAAMFEYIGLGEYIDLEFIDVYLSWAAMLVVLLSVIVFSFVFLLRKIIRFVDKDDWDNLLGVSCSFAIINALIVFVIFATYGTGRNITNIGTIENPINMLQITLLFIDSTFYIFPVLILLISYMIARKYIKYKTAFRYDLLILLAIILFIWISHLIYSPYYKDFYMARNSLFVINSFVCFFQILFFSIFYVLTRHYDIENKNNLKHDQLALFSTIFLIGASYLAYHAGYTDRKLVAATDILLIYYHNYLLLAYVLYVFWAFCVWCCFTKLKQLISTSNNGEY